MGHHPMLLANFRWHNSCIPYGAPKRAVVHMRNGKRVVLCDDHEIVRNALKARMANSGAVEIVGEARDGREVVEVVKDLDPDVVIIDVEMPKRDGIAATKEVVKARPR